jgi:hypothetical protein
VGPSPSLKSRTSTASAVRRDAVTNALESVRVEGLEPGVEGLALLEAIATGEMNGDQAIDQLRQRY